MWKMIDHYINQEPDDVDLFELCGVLYHYFHGRLARIDESEKYSLLHPTHGGYDVNGMTVYRDHEQLGLQRWDSFGLHTPILASLRHLGVVVYDSNGLYKIKKVKR